MIYSMLVGLGIGGVSGFILGWIIGACSGIALCKNLRKTMDETAKYIETHGRRLWETEGEGATLILRESHEGIVEFSDESEVAVTYNVNGDVVNQTYDQNQFLGNLLPEDGSRLQAHIRVYKVNEPPTPEIDIRSLEKFEGFSNAIRKKLDQPTEF